MSTKEQRGVEVMDAIRSVLIEDWNPIGIDGSAPQDEYDSYIAGVYRLVSRQASEDEIVDHLYRVEMSQIGTTPNQKEMLRPVAKKLLAINVSLKSR